MKKLKKLKGILSPKGASRTSCIILAGILSVPFTLFIVWMTNKILGIYFDTSISQILEPRGSWTLITLIFSAPVALVVWHFRDVNTKEQIENHKQQVENQRKDVNLKEFQKIAEWVSCLHFPEERNNKHADNHCAATSTDYYTRYNGAIGLQISAIHSLLPFYRGDYGELFTKPALNLLKSAWQMLHYHDLQQLKIRNTSEKDEIIVSIQERSKGSLGVALMQVLLTDGGKYLRKHPEAFSHLYFSGMNLHLFGLHEDIKHKLFYNLNSAQAMQFQAANLSEIYFNISNFQQSDFSYSNLNNTNFYRCILNFSRFCYANISNAHLKYTDIRNSNFNNSDACNIRLYNCNFQGSSAKNAKVEQAKFKNSDLSKCRFDKATLCSSSFEDSNLEYSGLYRANLRGAFFRRVNLNYVNLQNANLERSFFQDVSMIGANLIGTEGLTIETLKLIKNIKGAIFNNISHLSMDSEWTMYIKSKGAIIIIGKSLSLLGSNNKDTILIAENINEETRFEYKISRFDIDISSTELFNPDWKFEVKNKE